MTTTATEATFAAQRAEAVLSAYAGAGWRDEGGALCKLLTDLQALARAEGIEWENAVNVARWRNEDWEFVGAEPFYCLRADGELLTFTSMDAANNAERESHGSARRIAPSALTMEQRRAGAKWLRGRLPW